MSSDHNKLLLPYQYTMVERVVSANPDHNKLLLPPTNTTVDRVGLASFCCLQCVPQINKAQQQLLRNSRVINLNIWVR